MKKIQLTQGKAAIVDDEDYDRLAIHSWCISKCSNTNYALRGHKVKGKCHSVLMHREIMNATDGVEVDHINGNGIDNRKCNLRFVTSSQNKFNQKKQQRKTSSKYKGVYYHKRDKAWIARIQLYGCPQYLGNYATEKEAALAYNKAAVNYYGEYARLNKI